MSSAAIIAIAVGAVVLLAAVVLLTAARKSDVRGAGALSRETRRRDKDAGADLPTGPSGRAVERAAVEARTEAAAPASPPSVWVPPDREALAVSRRQFLNRANVALMGAGLGGFAAASFTAFLWPTAVCAPKRRSTRSPARSMATTGTWRRSSP